MGPARSLTRCGETKTKETDKTYLNVKYLWKARDIRILIEATVLMNVRTYVWYWRNVRKSLIGKQEQASVFWYKYTILTLIKPRFNEENTSLVRFEFGRAREKRAEIIGTATELGFYPLLFTISIVGEKVASRTRRKVQRARIIGFVKGPRRSIEWNENFPLAILVLAFLFSSAWFGRSVFLALRAYDLT